MDTDSIRTFLYALQARNEKDNGLFPQVASKVEADAKALDRVLTLLDFYHPPRPRWVACPHVPGASCADHAECCGDGGCVRKWPRGPAVTHGVNPSTKEQP
jgi:hypothetical protein